jgi:hypothetical protein
VVKCTGFLISVRSDQMPKAVKVRNDLRVRDLLAEPPEPDWPLRR